MCINLTSIIGKNFKHYTHYSRTYFVLLFDCSHLEVIMLQQTETIDVHCTALSAAALRDTRMRAPRAVRWSADDT